MLFRSVSQSRYVTQNIIQKIGNDKVRIQTEPLSNAQQNTVQDKLAAKFGVNVDSIDSQIIGPSWGKEITRKALYGLFGFLIVVLLYLSNSCDYLDEVECSEKSSSIRPRSDWQSNIQKGIATFQKKHTFLPAFQNCVPDSTPVIVKRIMKTIFNKYSKQKNES